LSEAETYSARLRELLQKQIGQRKTVEVINAGVNAGLSPNAGLFPRYCASISPGHRHSGRSQSLDPVSEKNSPEFVKTFMRRVRLKNFLRHFAIYHYIVEVKLKDFYERHRTRFIPVDPQQDPAFKSQQQADPEAFFHGAIAELCRLAREKRVRPVLLYLPAFDRAGAPMRNQFVGETRGEPKASVPLLDLTTDVQTGGKILYLEADPVHFSNAGNEVIAQRLLETIRL